MRPRSIFNQVRLQLFVRAFNPGNFLRRAVLAALLLKVVLPGANAQTAQTNSTLYDSDPKHLWNRLEETLFVRTAPDGQKYGLGELDILYWFRTEHLLTEPSHRQALAILSEFVNSHGEKLISDPLKRALLQRDLWKLFDWSAKKIPHDQNAAKARRELQTRLAVVMRRIALTTNEIQSLPDNYARAQKDAFSANPPRALFQTNGDWIEVGRNFGEPTAPAHVTSFAGHSAFLVLFHHPDGRQAATKYLARLGSSQPTWIYGTNLSSHSADPPPPILNPKLPQFPSGTEWALVRQMCLVDSDGQIQATPLIESVQVRRYWAVQPLKNTPPSLADDEQSIASQTISEFQMDRNHEAALRATGHSEKDFNFVHFAGLGIDPFEQHLSRPMSDSSALKGNVLATCQTCHGTPGLYSVNTFTRSFTHPPSFSPIPIIVISPDREIAETISWKHRQYDWGLLQGLWAQND